MFLTGEGMKNSNNNVNPKKKMEGRYSTIPDYGSAIGGVTVLRNTDEIEKVKKDQAVEDDSEGPRYNYIGYEQNYSIDDSQSYASVELLKKMAINAMRANNYPLTIEYLNKILVKDPTHKEALFFKKKVLMKIKELKQNAL
jgi:hypothetical protein